MSLKKKFVVSPEKDVASITQVQVQMGNWLVQGTSRGIVRERKEKNINKSPKLRNTHRCYFAIKYREFYNQLGVNVTTMTHDCMKLKGIKVSLGTEPLLKYLFQVTTFPICYAGNRTRRVGKILQKLCNVVLIPNTGGLEKR